jgi:rubredoxin
MFADIPSGRRCPDCGTEKATFRPYVDANHLKSALQKQS